MFKFKDQLSEWYRPHDSFLVRCPLLPVNVFFQWNMGHGSDVTNSKQVLRRSLRKFFLQPVAGEALYIASPDMHARSMHWINDKIEKPDKKEKAELSLLKYMSRMSNRCTPYGLFATCTIGILKDETRIELCDKDQLLRFGRLDMDRVCGLHAELLKLKDISGQLHFFPNSSLYRCGSSFRYIEYRLQELIGRSYHIVEIEHSSSLERILTAAIPGLKKNDLAAFIADDQIPFSEALAFIDELVESQVLVDELNPSITGEEYFSVLLSRLKTLQHTEKFVDRLELVSALFEQIRRAGDNGKYELYVQIERELSLLINGHKSGSLIQVDSYREASSCTLNKKLSDEILKGINLLRGIAGDQTLPDPFEDFKNAFRKRYDDEWVPLVEVLDTEWGIGPGSYREGKFHVGGSDESPLVAKLPLGKTGNDLSVQGARNTGILQWQLYQESITKNCTEVRIDDKQVEQLSKKEINIDELPDSFSAMVRINAATAKDIDNGNYTLFINSVTGPSGANLLARFCHLHPGIEKLARGIVEAEEVHHPDCLYAEIVHLPEARTGNILVRPIFRGYEIPYLCNSTLDKEFQIPVNDLLVGIEEGKVILWSRRLDKQVIPRLTTAHNYHLSSLPVYRFLCDLQNQGSRLPRWDWGGLSDRPFLPQVCYGRFILSKARWILVKEDMENCYNKNDEATLVVTTALRKLKKLPVHVLLTQGDNELLLDLQNIFCIRLLLAELNKRGSVILTEATDTPDQCWIKSPEGDHVAEFIMAFNREKVKTPQLSANTILKKDNNKPVQRIFPVGSEWLYAKIYCGTSTAEKILSHELRSLTERLYAERIIDKFFFLRYYDDGPHIRIRFHNAVKKDFWKEIIPLLQKELQPYTDDRTVHNIQFETYRREIERYGEDTMELSEDLFWQQSKAIMEFISMLDGDEGEQYRWQAGLKAIDLLLDAFRYTLEQKCKLVRRLNKNYSEEFRIGHAERKKISDQFSDHKPRVNLLMSDGWQQDENLAEGIQLLIPGTDIFHATIEGILNAPSVVANPMQLDLLMQSYLHMFINRLFVSNHRKTELVIYEYLLKYYESKRARTLQEGREELSQGLSTLGINTVD
ncbi:MAG TPA: lantibiotic dehydratase [Chitinophagaceae bacterium]|nr:lantibiotic dehydratase [Chitinophagaceae bacterium]